MSLSWIALAFRLHRFAALAFGLTVVLLAALAVWSAARLDGYPDAIRCLTEGGEACVPYLNSHEFASRILTAIAIVPLIGGAMLGVPIVAQELERSTIALAWSLEPSRWRWFLHRSVPLAAFGILLGVVAAVTSDHLEARLFPMVDPGSSFHDYGMRGPILVGRLMLALGCGVLIGALTGRTLPALVITLLVAAGLSVTLATTHESLEAAQAIATPSALIDERFAGRQVDFKYELQSGEIVSYEQAEARFPDPAALEAQLASTKEIVYVVPGTRYGRASAGESTTTAAVGLLAFLGALLVVTNRRPGLGLVRIQGIARRTDRARSTASRGFPSLRLIRLAVWPHRVELLIGASLAAVVGAGSVLVLGSLAATTPPPACLADLANIPATPECASVSDFLGIASEWGARLFASMAILPWVVGVFLGVMIVAREIELGTATFAWSMSPDRRRWLLTRAAVVGGLLVLLLIVPSALSTEMQRQARPWVAPEMTLDNYGLRGPLVVLRGLAAMSLALVIGAILGRVLPSIIVAGALTVALAFGLQALWPFGQRPDPRPAAEPGTGVSVSSDLPYIAGERLREIELREGIVLVALSGTFLAAATLTVDRRRPY